MSGDCLEWPSDVMPDRWGRVKVEGRLIKAARVIYCRHHGLTTESIQHLLLFNTCGGAACANPLHMDVKRRGTHGLTRSPTWNSWNNMRNRCLDPESINFENYGGRGIKVCARWASSFENFLADMGSRPPGMTLDRYPDTNGNYGPGNCRWATQSQQDRNRRSNRMLTINGITKCATDWADGAGISVHTFLCRIDRYGMSPEKALNHVAWAKRTKSELKAIKEANHGRDI